MAKGKYENKLINSVGDYIKKETKKIHEISDTQNTSKISNTLNTYDTSNTYNTSKTYNISNTSETQKTEETQKKSKRKNKGGRPSNGEVHRFSLATPKDLWELMEKIAMFETKGNMTSYINNCLKEFTEYKFEQYKDILDKLDK